MSDSIQNSTPGVNGKARPMPRAMIHKQILDAAESRPDAAMDELAADVSGASPELVERVLEDHGDPAEPGENVVTGNADGPEVPPAELSNELDASPDTNDTEQFAGREQLTDTQLETLQTLYEDPDATQAQLAERLGVSRSAINQRLNGIEGFEWADRATFVMEVFGPRTSVPRNETDSEAASRDVPTVEKRSSSPANCDATSEPRHESTEKSGTGAFDDPNLVHKILTACLEADYITEAEERLIVQELIVYNRDRTPTE